MNRDAYNMGEFDQIKLAAVKSGCHFDGGVSFIFYYIKLQNCLKNRIGLFPLYSTF